MPRVIGIDPGTVSVDVYGLDDGRVFLDESVPTGDALADPSPLLELLGGQHRTRPLDLVAGPSGYGLPLTSVADLTDNDLRLAFLTADGEAGGIGGLRRLVRGMARVAPSVPVVLTPGVIHLSSVPAYRKVNRVDMGTADKVCAAALALHEEAGRLGCRERDVSFIFLELGGAFSAGLAVERGCIVDGYGGTAGPLGLRAAGALDGEVAFLAGTITKDRLFQGGAASIAGAPDAPAEAVANPRTPQARLARDAYLESAVKTVAALAVAATGACVVILSGRMARADGLREDLERRLAGVHSGGGVGTMTTRVLKGLGGVAKHAAQGAALVADGLAGGAAATLVDALGIRTASGTVLDHLYVISPAAARARLGII